MPTQTTYPGVYIEEVPSGVRSIAGVSTSITAFLGRALRGPVGEPVTVFGFGEFTRSFGGLWSEGPMTYGLRDFFLNGGRQAMIVRLYEPATVGASGIAGIDVGTLKLTASNPGFWGNSIKVTIEHPADVAAAADVAKRHGLVAADLFNLQVEDTGSGRREQFHNVAVKQAAGALRVDRVLAAGSSLVRVALDETGAPQLPAARPADKATGTGTKGEDSAPIGENQFKGDEAKKTGLFALEKADLFNILCIPPDTREGDVPPKVFESAAAYCQRRRAFLLVDPPAAWGKNPETAAATAKASFSAAPPVPGTSGRNAALFFPRVVQRDPARDGQLDVFVPSGIMAGVMARTDATRGVWKAPAGVDAALRGIERLQVKLTDDENGLLNPLGINCLRAFPVTGRVAWGARTLRGADQLADDYKYIPVRRLALFIEESLYRGTQWVVFEPNDEPLWSQIRLAIGTFMQRLFRQGAFQGTSPRDAYFVQCDKDTTTQDDIDRGVVNIVVGFAPLQPAEFVVIHIQQIRGEA